jgi:hypothetical protein
VLKEKLNETASGFSKIAEEHKQLTYELSRTSNELKNKEAALGESNEKLKIMTQRYN